MENDWAVDQSTALTTDENNLKITVCISELT